MLCSGTFYLLILQKIPELQIRTRENEGDGLKTLVLFVGKWVERG
jgi:hypothetical protein